MLVNSMLVNVKVIGNLKKEKSKVLKLENLTQSVIS